MRPADANARGMGAWLPLAVLVVGLTTTGLAAWSVHRSAREEDEAHLRAAAAQTREAIARRAESYVALLRGAAALFSADRDVTRDEFHAYIGRLNLAANYPGTLGVGYSRRVERDQLAALEAALREENPGYPGRWVQPGAVDDPSGHVHVIVYLEPLNWRNQRAMGYDMFSEPTRRAAMERARDLGRPAASGVIRLVQETDQQPQPGFLIYLPVYRDAKTPAELEERRASLEGFVYAPIRVGDLLEGLFGTWGAPTEVEIHDGAVTTPIYRFGDSPGAAPRTRLVYQDTLDLCGETWRLTYRPRAGALASSGTRFAPLVGLAGAGITLILALVSLSLVRAVAQLRRSRDELRQTEEQFRTAFDLAAVGKTMSDALTGRYLRVNAKFCQITGYAEHELIGRTFEEITHPEDLRASRAAMGDLVAGRVREARVEKRYCRKDGGVVWVRVNAAMVRDGEGRPVRVIAAIEDITQRRADLEGIRRSEGLLKAVVEGAADGILTMDQDGRVLTFNPAAERIFGYAAGEVTGRHVSMLVPDLSGGAQGEGTPRDVAGMIGGGGEVRGRRKDGREFPIELAVSETHWGDESGRRLYTGIVRDISERKAADEALRASEARFRLMADAAPVLIWIADRGQRFTWCNQGWLDFTGRTLEQELGEGWIGGVQTEDAARCRETYRAAFEERRPFKMEFRLRRRDGQFRWVLDHGTPLYGAGGEFTGYIGSCIDITDRKRAEEDLQRYTQELARQTAELARSNADLADFAHVAAHDLKEPLRGIRQTASFLIEDSAEQLGATGVERLERLDRLAKRMHDLLDALLEFGQLGRGELNVRECPLGSLAADVRTALAGLLQRENVELVIRHPLPTLCCDRVLTGQVLINLVANGIKYNDAERKRVELGAVTGAGPAVVYVRDNGIGIDAAHHESVFRMFKRLHTRERYGGGSGAGLAIVKRIVERHGGRIWIDSGAGRGSTFYFTLAPGDPGPVSAPPLEQPIIHSAPTRAASAAPGA